MPASEDAKLDILHKHYEDSCSVAQAFRAQRDRLFVRILAILAFALYDVYAPNDFGRLLSTLIADKGGLRPPPDLRYIGSLLWFALLGLVVRYGQAAVHLERQYSYLRDLEEQLATAFDGRAFTREGVSYLSLYPAFSNWAHILYTIVFPILLATIVGVKGWRALVTFRAESALVWFDCFVGAALLTSMLLYLQAIHGPPSAWRWLPHLISRGKRSVIRDSSPKCHE